MLFVRNADPLYQGVPKFRPTAGTARGGPFLQGSVVRDQESANRGKEHLMPDA